MAQDKVFNIQIGGIKESITNLESLESVLASLESKVKEINDKGGFSVANKESAKAMDELGKLTQKITQYDEEYQRAVEASKGVLKDKNNEVKQAIELEKANLVIEEGAKSTYNEKQQLLGALGKQIKSMSTDTEENKQKQQELIAQYAALNQELKDFDASLGNHQRNVGDYGQATKNLKQELKELQAEMATMLNDGVDKADPKFVSLAQKAGQLKDALNDAGEEVKRFASDTKAIDGAINLAQSATAAFQLYKGAMSAFGMETEAAEEAIQKLAGAMSIIQSLQTLQETLQTGSATAKAFNLIMKATGAELVTTQLASIKATAAQQGLTTAQKAGAIASKTLSLALKAIPLMLVIGLVTELIMHWDDLVGWFNKTFPVLNKLGGAMNALKAVFVGLGKAIINWVTNPLKTLADVISKIFKGDFEGALKAATDGIKNQFKGTVDAFKSGYQAQIESGLEEITKKAASEQAKQTKYELDMLKARKGNQAKYSKEGIALQKKEFEQRKRAAKGNAEELKQIALDEANFTRECEEQKGAAAKKSADARVKANKDAAEAAKKTAEEERKRREEEEKQRKALVDADTNLRNEQIKAQKQANTVAQKAVKIELEKYSTGPLEKYKKKLEELLKLQKSAVGMERGTEYSSLFAEILKDYPKLVEGSKDASDAMQKVTDLATELADGAEQLYIKLRTVYKFNEVEAKKVLTLIQKIRTNALEGQADIEEANREFWTNLSTASKNELDDLANDAERSYNWLMKRIKTMDVKPVAKDNIWGKLFGVIDEQETLNKYERIKKMWVRAYNEIQAVIEASEQKWEDYLVQVETLYGKDSIQYKKAVQQKMDALEALRKKALEVGKVANAPVSLNGDLNADNQPDSPSGGTVDVGGKVQQGLGQFNDFMTKINDTLLAPMMDTFSMFMDFAIEETAQKLEQVEELHDKALDKVNDSADKIKELNDSLKDSSNTNLEQTKQQLADEQLLYAQRLAEERKLAEEEKALKNKQAQQEANARKMELRYQMVMAIANTAQGASKALATWGWPLGAVFAGVMAALGAIQVALIAKQISAIKPVKYAEGGVINAPSHAQGGARIEGTNIEVEGGEMVINKYDTVRYKDILYKINNNDPSVRYLQGNTKTVVTNSNNLHANTRDEYKSATVVTNSNSLYTNTRDVYKSTTREFADTTIRKYANGGQLNFERADANLQASTSTNKLMSAINDIDMQPIVSVVDFWKAENRLVRVRGLSGRNE